VARLPAPPADPNEWLTQSRPARRHLGNGESIRYRGAKRRTKVIGRFPGETSCLTLVWAVLDLYITHATNGIKFTQLERQRLKRIRYEGHGHPISEEVTAA